MPLINTNPISATINLWNLGFDQASQQAGLMKSYLSNPVGTSYSQMQGLMAMSDVDRAKAEGRAALAALGLVAGGLKTGAIETGSTTIYKQGLSVGIKGERWGVRAL